MCSRVDGKPSYHRTEPRKRLILGNSHCIPAASPPGFRYNRPVTEKILLRHATRMAVVTMASRLTGWVRDKALFWVLGASDLNDAFRVAFRIPNAFRALLAEGALHAAFVPALSPLAGREDGRRGDDDGP